MMAPTKMKLREKKRVGGGKSSQRLLANASPDSKCPICLDGFNNVASLDRCLHQFCFRCIREWSKNKAECPLCKQPFHSIFHSVKGENDFKEFVLRPAENGAAPTADPSERMLRPRVLRGRARRSQRLQQPAPSPPLDDDVMFGGLSDAPGLAENQDMQRMVMRLTARRRGRGEGRNLRRLRDQDVVAFRRALYRTGVRARNTRDMGRQRDVSATFLRQNPACLHRLLPWLQRELTVLYGSHGSLVNIVQHVIMSRITNYNMEDSAIRDELRPFLLARTDHFLHELVSFARSTLSMEAYDQQAVYDCPAPSYEEGSSSDSSVIAISEDDENNSEDNITENPSVVLERLPPAPPTPGTGNLLSESAWDDETPGPSYSTLLPSSSQSQDEGPQPSSSTALIPAEPGSSISVSGRPGADDDGEEEECLIVGYVKPMAERTPELVQLSSDSSEEEQEATTMDTKAIVPKEEGSQVKSHVDPVSPGSSPGPAPSCSPQRTHSDSHVQESHSRERIRNCSPSSRDHQAHRRRHGSKDCLQATRDCFDFSDHKRRKSRLHQNSDHTEHAETWERSQLTESQGDSHARSPSKTLSPRSWSGQSPPMSIWSGSEQSPFRSDISSDKSPERSHHVRERCSRAKERGSRRKEKMSRSPDSDSWINSHRPSSRSKESQWARKRRRRSVSSSSSADSCSERSRLDKPSGKRKYKTRHLERAAQRQQTEGTTSSEKLPRQGRKERRRSRERRLSRSPSVEIIYECKAPDWHQRKKRRHRKKKREHRSPTVITIDSDSDRTIDCLDRVVDVLDQTTSGIDDEQMVDREQCVIHPAVNSSTLSSLDSLLESSMSDPATVSLNLDDCVVDVVKHSSSKTLDCNRNIDTNISHAESVPDPLIPVDSMMTTQPSDTRLLESILQDLEDFLPVVEEDVVPKPQNTVSPQRDETNLKGESEGLENRNTDSDEQQETEAS
ncbi:uncharacterized protein toporsb [Paramisgurnus dabryanus]|uniref:uncharacterized protein toporsb n=1 Tax=Paramisgurnus dabryanus TaxID=90735 RepID=UPI0031F3FAA2